MGSSFSKKTTAEAQRRSRLQQLEIESGLWRAALAEATAPRQFSSELFLNLVVQGRKELPLPKVMVDKLLAPERQTERLGGGGGAGGGAGAGAGGGTRIRKESSSLIRPPVHDFLEVPAPRRASVRRTSSGGEDPTSLPSHKSSHRSPLHGPSRRPRRSSDVPEMQMLGSSVRVEVSSDIEGRLTDDELDLNDLHGIGDVQSTPMAVGKPVATLSEGGGAEVEMMLPPVRERSTSNAIMSCVVCMENMPDTRMDPCGHMSTCVECAIKILGVCGPCPMCRSSIQALSVSFFKGQVFSGSTPSAAPSGADGAAEGSPHRPLETKDTMASNFWKVLDVMRANPGSRPCCAAGLQAARVFLRHESVRVLITPVAVQLIIIPALLHREDVDVARCAAACIRNIAWQTSLRQMVVDEGGLTTLLMLMGQHQKDEETLTQGLAALVNMFLLEEVREVISREPVVPYLLVAMQNSTLQSIHSPAMYVLQCLPPSRMWYEACARFGAIQMVLHSLALYPNEPLLVFKGLSAIRRMITDDRIWEQFKLCEGKDLLLQCEDDISNVSDLLFDACLEEIELKEEDERLTKK